MKELADISQEIPTEKKQYIKPEYKLETNMTFMYDAIEQSSQYTCRQCSSCHGCR